MKRMMNQPGTEYDGLNMTYEDGAAAIRAIGNAKGWPANILALELQSWADRF